jgi:hypothetical protein
MMQPQVTPEDPEYRKPPPGPSDIALRIAFGFAIVFALDGAWAIWHSVDALPGWTPLAWVLLLVFGLFIGLIPGVLTALLLRKPHRLHFLLGIGYGILFIVIRILLER